MTTTQSNNVAPPRRSWTDRLRPLEVGARIYVETALRGAVSRQQSLARAARELPGRVYTTSLFTAVGAARTGDVRYLVCVERIA
jgi:hypothetical protein